MASPLWLAYAFAVLMVAVSVYCIGRLVLAAPMGRRNHYDVNAAHVLMGVAMVGMLVPRWNVIPVVLWELVFAALAVYFIVQAVVFVRRYGFVGSDEAHVHRVTHSLVHALLSFAMLYMYWLGMPVTSSTGTMGMSGPPTGAGDPALTLLLIALLFGSAIWELDGIGRFAVARATAVRAAGASPSGSFAIGQAAAPTWLAPRLEVWCHIAMCVTMGYMLILMV